MIVTFLNRNPIYPNDISGKDIATFVANSNAFNFLNDEEDIYTDDNLKIKY